MANFLGVSLSEFPMDTLFVVIALGVWLVQRAFRKSVDQEDRLPDTRFEFEEEESLPERPKEKPLRSETLETARKSARRPQPKASPPSPRDEPSRQSEPILNSKTIRQAIIASEILGKPKSLR